jgi:hypothetical protein
VYDSATSLVARLASPLVHMGDTEIVGPATGGDSLRYIGPALGSSTVFESLKSIQMTH